MMGVLKFALLFLVIGFTSASLQCGGRTLNSMSPDTWMCCGGKPYHKNSNVFACCNKECYNALSQLCCGGDIYTRVNANSACCNGKYFQRGNKGCCNGQIFDLRTHDCCRHVKYSRDDETCCNGTVIPKDKTGKRTVCCGKKLYDPLTEKCCAEKVVEAVAGVHTKCCDSTPYDSQTKSCCNEKVIPRVGGKDKCCNGKMMNSRHNICCGDHAQPRVYGKQDTGCCRVGEPVAPSTRYAEDIVGLMKANIHKRSHIGHFITFDKTKAMCCSGKLNRIKSGKSTGCCNRNAYDVRTEICCGVRIYEKIPGEQERCCAGRPYNRKSHICCHNTLNALIPGGEMHSFCCGRKMFDRRKQKCEKENKLISLECEKTVDVGKGATK